MNTLTIKASDYQGIDRSIEIALFEQGVVWRQIEDKRVGGNKYEFVIQINFRGSTRYGTITLVEGELDTNWLDLEGLTNTLGISVESWHNQGLPQKIFDIVNYTNPQNLIECPRFAEVQLVMGNEILTEKSNDPLKKD